MGCKSRRARSPFCEQGGSVARTTCPCPPISSRPPAPLSSACRSSSMGQADADPWQNCHGTEGGTRRVPRDFACGGRFHFSRGAPASRNLSWNAEPPDGLATCEKKNEKPPGYGSTIKQRQGRRVGPALPPPRTSSASARPVSSCGCVGS